MDMGRLIMSRIPAVRRSNRLAFYFHWGKSGEYVTQMTAIDPSGLEYLDPGDDPRNKSS